MAQLIALEELNFVWNMKIVDKVVDMWKNGDKFEEIVKFTGRSEEETFLLLLHLALKSRIKKRKGYIWGDKNEFSGLSEKSS